MAKRVHNVHSHSPKNQMKESVREVNWVLCLVMPILFCGFGIWWLVDVILVATKYQFKGIKWVE